MSYKIPYLEKLQKDGSPWLVDAMKAGLNHDVPGMFRSDLAKIAVEQAIKFKKIALREERAAEKKQIEAAKNVMHFASAVTKESAKDTDLAARILTGMAKKKKKGGRGGRGGKGGKVNVSIIGKITFKNGDCSYKTLWNKILHL